MKDKTKPTKEVTKQYLQLTNENLQLEQISNQFK